MVPASQITDMRIRPLRLRYRLYRTSVLHTGATPRPGTKGAPSGANVGDSFIPLSSRSLSFRSPASRSTKIPSRPRVRVGPVAVLSSIPDIQGDPAVVSVPISHHGPLVVPRHNPRPASRYQCQSPVIGRPCLAEVVRYAPRRHAYSPSPTNQAQSTI